MQSVSMINGLNNSVTLYQMSTVKFQNIISKHSQPDRCASSENMLAQYFIPASSANFRKMALLLSERLFGISTLIFT